ncbi:E3 ubiquitin-protein ligase TRIM35-like [Corythoichthys intestinalis]|uniref:E3 ubiquitin-protein ligase TRIM35-like n=1 Tax=Corythoichthys intestinalis TaxID=161448 RepID=UPI0025A658C2|nr:E3 ubiquitin-protein ligase TRIM35-like [Corythoichthys intestinalis]
MAGRMEDNLQCLTCLDVCNDLVVLPCSHRFCHSCLQQLKDKGEQLCQVCGTEFSSLEGLINLSRSFAARVEDNLQCPTCLDIFKDPVMLSCGHNLCRVCLQQWKDKGQQSCPLCRTEFSSIDLPLNLALKNVCENLSLASVKLEDIVNKEEFKLFCLDHQELVSIECINDEIHAGHHFCQVDEAAKGHKEKLQDRLQDAQKCLKDFNVCRDNCNEQAAYIKVQREKVESKIKKDFEELRHFLDIEEEAMLAAVREEEEKKSQVLKEKIVALGREMAVLSDAINSAEEQLATDHVSFLKNYQTEMTRIRKLPNKPELPRGALLDESKHVGNLKFSVWERMKESVSFSPIILDPNTAGQGLRLSEDLTVLSCQEGEAQRPRNLERGGRHHVLGSALVLGTHEWEVEVGDNAYWCVGVAWGDPCSPFNIKDRCVIRLRDGEYKILGDSSGLWNPPAKPQKIRVCVDMNKRRLSISESLRNTKICTKTNIDLSGNRKLLPYFFTKDERPLRIIPCSRHVTTPGVEEN